MTQIEITCDLEARTCIILGSLVVGVKTNLWDVILVFPVLVVNLTKN